MEEVVREITLNKIAVEQKVAFQLCPTTLKELKVVL